MHQTTGCGAQHACQKSDKAQHQYCCWKGSFVALVTYPWGRHRTCSAAIFNFPFCAIEGSRVQQHEESLSDANAVTVSKQFLPFELVERGHTVLHWIGQFGPQHGFNSHHIVLTDVELDSTGGRWCVPVAILNTVVAIFCGWPVTWLHVHCRDNGLSQKRQHSVASASRTLAWCTSERGRTEMTRPGYCHSHRVEGCSTVSGVVERGVPPPPPFVAPNLGGWRVGRSAAGLPRGGRWVPKHMNIYKWGKFFSKKIAHQLRLPSAKVRPGGRVWVKILFLCFSSIFEFSTKF